MTIESGNESANPRHAGFPPVAMIDVVAGSFHCDSVAQMVEEASAKAEELSAKVRNVVWVPGSMEKPLAAKRLLIGPSPPDALVVLGIIERGETAHGHVMGVAVVKALIDLQLQFNRPIGIGILGPDIYSSQIASRLGPYAHSAVAAVVAMCPRNHNQGTVTE